jgi:hypothetical protein
MKTAGDVLSVLFDRQFVEKAHGYSKLFNSWADITAKNGIAAASAHSRIKDLDRGILLVEMDHPGWKQILQTKQTKLLNDFRYRFPELDISGISLMLSRPEPAPEVTAVNEPLPEFVVNETPAQAVYDAESCEKPSTEGYESIKDEVFKERLKRIEQNIAARDAEKLHG